MVIKDNIFHSNILNRDLKLLLDCQQIQKKKKNYKIV